MVQSTNLYMNVSVRLSAMYNLFWVISLSRHVMYVCYGWVNGWASESVSDWIRLDLLETANQISCCKGKWYVRRFNPDTVQNGHMYSSIRGGSIHIMGLLQHFLWVYMKVEDFSYGRDEPWGLKQLVCEVVVYQWTRYVFVYLQR